MTGPSPVLDLTDDEFRRLYSSLVRLFRATGLPDPQNLAGKVIERTLANIRAGRPVDSLVAYMRTVALNIAHEERRRLVREQHLLSEMARSEHSPDPPREIEKRLAECIDRLPVEDRKLLQDYYGQDGRDSIRHRQAMARKLGISPDALSMRILRIRKKVRACAEKRDDAGKAEGKA